MYPMQMLQYSLRPSRHIHRLTASLVALFIVTAAALAYAADRPTKDRDADLDQLVAETHKASLKLREEALRKTIAKVSVGAENPPSMSA
jgi:preprotein translocase subunit SecG